MGKIKNARFWEIVNGGPVKITLHPGDELHWATGGTDTEGYWKEYRTWVHRGDHVYSAEHMEGRDCDGYISRGHDCVCPLDQLAANDRLQELSEFAGILMPAWRQDDDCENWQRDHAAEAAGY